MKDKAYYVELQRKQAEAAALDRSREYEARWRSLTAHSLRRPGELGVVTALRSQEKPKDMPGYDGSGPSTALRIARARAEQARHLAAVEVSPIKWERLRDSCEHFAGMLEAQES